MKCTKCGSTWETKEDVFKCPFCGADLVAASDDCFDNSDSVEVHNIDKQIETYGVEVSTKAIGIPTMDSENEGSTKEVQYNGLYCCKENDYSYYLRFFPDNTVVSVSCTGSPEQVAEWLDYDYKSRGIYTIYNGLLEFQIISSEGIVDYIGSIIDRNSISLTSFSKINNNRYEKRYIFYPTSQARTTFREIITSGLTVNQAKEFFQDKIRSGLSTNAFCHEHGITRDEWRFFVMSVLDEAEDKETKYYKEDSGVFLYDASFYSFSSVEKKRRSAETNPTPLYKSIGIIGEDGHGKTTLLKSIAQMLLAKNNMKADTEYSDLISDITNQTKLVEGVSTSMSMVEYDTPACVYFFYDFPSFDDLVKSTIAGFVQLDGVLSVVSAVDGCMSATYEGLHLSKRLGIPCVAAFVNKCDLVHNERRLDLSETEIRELLNQCGFPGDYVPISHGSALNSLAPLKEEWNSDLYRLVCTMDEYIHSFDSIERYPTNVTEFEAEIYVLKKEEGGSAAPFCSGLFYFTRPDSNGKIKLSNQQTPDICPPGEHVSTTIKLDKTIALEKGDHFRIISKFDSRMIALGMVTKV